MRGLTIFTAYLDSLYSMDIEFLKEVESLFYSFFLSLVIFLVAVTSRMKEKEERK